MCVKLSDCFVDVVNEICVLLSVCVLSGVCWSVSVIVPHSTSALSVLLSVTNGVKNVLMNVLMNVVMNVVCV